MSFHFIAQIWLNRLQGKRVALKSSFGTFLRITDAHGNLGLTAGRGDVFDLSVVGPFQIALKSPCHLWIAAEPSGKLIANRGRVGSYEKSDIIFFSQDNIGLVSVHKKYVAGSKNGQIAASSSLIQSFQVIIKDW